MIYDFLGFLILIAFEILCIAVFIYGLNKSLALRSTYGDSE